MHITHFGHACVLIEIDSTSVRIDPGSPPAAAQARKIVTFSPDGRHVAALAAYKTKLRDSASSADERRASS